MAKRSRRRQKRAEQLAARKRGETPPQTNAKTPAGPRATASATTPASSGGGGRLAGRSLPIPFPSFDLRRVLVAGAAVLAIAGALIITLGGGSSNAAGIVDLPDYLNPAGQPVSVREGALAPDFELINRDASRFRLSDWRGHPVLLNFWASWCGPCRTEMPAIVALEAQFRDVGLKVVGVNIQEGDRNADGFISEFAMRFDVPMDRGGDVTDKYIRTGPPHTFFIDPDGMIQRAFLGGAPGSAFQDQVVALMQTLDAPIDAQLAPGLKAVPTTLVSNDADVSGNPGHVAPDFVLSRTDRPADRLRLSDLRGQPLLLAFEPPQCQGCAAATADALRLAQQAGVIVLVVSAIDDPRADGLLFDWQPAVAAAFAAARTQRFVLISADGVVQARQDPGDDLAAALAALAPTA